MAFFRRRSIKETLNFIKRFSDEPLSPTAFSQAISGRGSISSGPTRTKIADLRFYGLVNRLKDGNYKFTDICKALKTSVSPKKRKEALAKAFVTNPAFLRIYNMYKGTRITVNALIVDEVADALDKSAEYAGGALEAFQKSGIFAGAITKGTDGSIQISNIDGLVGQLLDEKEAEKERQIDKKKKTEPDRRTREGLDTPIEPRTPVGISINLNIDGSTTPELADSVFAFLREAGIGEKRAHTLELLVTKPPMVRELLDAIERMILEAKTEITIMTPYLDNQVLNILLPKVRDGVKTTVVTRNLSQVTGAEAKRAWKHLAEKQDINHQCYNLLHGRMIIVDNSIVLVSSADISHDSLIGQFNAGIITTDPGLVKKAVGFVKAILKEAKKSKVT